MEVKEGKGGEMVMGKTLVGENPGLMCGILVVCSESDINDFCDLGQELTTK